MDTNKAISSTEEAVDPSIPLENGRAPLLELPDELLKQIAGHVWPILFTGRPANAGRTPEMKIDYPIFDNPTNSHALASTCQRLYATLSDSAYTNIDWQLDRDWYDTEKDSAGEYITRRMPPACAKHMRFVTGGIRTIERFLDLLPNRRINPCGVVPEQLDICVIQSQPRGKFFDPAEIILKEAEKVLESCSEVFQQYSEVQAFKLIFEPPERQWLSIMENVVRRYKNVQENTNLSYRDKFEGPLGITFKKART